MVVPTPDPVILLAWDWLLLPTTLEGSGGGEAVGTEKHLSVTLRLAQQGKGLCDLT